MGWSGPLHSCSPAEGVWTGLAQLSACCLFTAVPPRGRWKRAGPGWAPLSARKGVEGTRESLPHPWPALISSMQLPAKAKVSAG